MPRAIVCGAGGISGAWFPPLKQENVEVAAVVDLHRDAAEEKIARWELTGAEACDDLHAALKAHADADFLVDLTIPEAHCEVTCAALEAGLHVIGEKPMAGDMDQARRMVATAEKTGKLYMVSQSRRWIPAALTVCNAVDRKLLGDLTAVHCDFMRGVHFGGFRAEMDHVLLVDMAIHHFDLARMMSHVDPVAVYCEEYNPRGSWYRHGAAAEAIFEMTGGVRFTYRGSWCAEGRHDPWAGNWRFQHVHGSIHWANERSAVAHRAVGEAMTRDSRQHLLPDAKPAAQGQHAALREMLRYLDDGTTPQSECHDNIQSFAMVCAAAQSAETRQRVRIRDLF